MVQMPSGIPVATVTIDSGLNAVLMAMQIMSIKYPKLKEDLKNYREEMAQKVLKDDEIFKGVINMLLYEGKAKKIFQYGK